MPSDNATLDRRSALPLVVAALVFLVLIVAGSAYYYFSGKEYVYRFTEEQIREKLAAKLPFTRSYLLVFQVTLDNPRVELINGSDRIRAGLDLVLNIRLDNSTTPLGGSIDVSGGLAYDASKGQFFLNDPIIETLDISGIPAKRSQQAAAIIAKAVAEYYRDKPIYELALTDTKQAAARLVLKNVVVENQVLVVTLGI